MDQAETHQRTSAGHEQALLERSRSASQTWDSPFYSLTVGDPRRATRRDLPCDRRTPISSGMTLKTCASSTILTLIRTGFVIILLLALNVPHISMAQAQQAPTMVMSHVSDAGGAMNHEKGLHERMNGSLCATICAGTTAFEGIAFPVRYNMIVPVRWRVEIALAWVQPTPDPALRPPDLLRLV